MERFLYRAYRANLRRNHHQPPKPARIERPYMWMLWGAYGIAYTLKRAQHWREYQAKTTVKDVK